MNSKIIAYAIKAHADTNHFYDKDKPYAVHLAIVAEYAMKFLYLIPDTDNNHQNIIDAAWLHDTIEDCRKTYNDIKEAAGFEVAEIVFALTNDKGRNRLARAGSQHYADMRGVLWARYVKMCDRMANAAYSKQNSSRMLDVYRKENKDFIDHLFPSPSDRERIYKPMINELKSLLAWPSSSNSIAA